MIASTKTNNQGEQPVRVLVACENSGRVRDAFTRHGHDAVSCDILPTETPGKHHQGDVLELLSRESFDLMVAHPPCTHLSVSGARHFKAKRADGRQQMALEFVRLLLTARVPRIALENPVSIISSQIRKPEQIIQPWQFGHPESKTTCLWLKGLEPLVHTNVLPKPTSGRWENQTPSGQNKLGPSKDRWKLRSATYHGIAEAMAAQWGEDTLERRGV